MTFASAYSPNSLGGRLDRDHVHAYCGILLAVEIAVFVFVAAGTWGMIVPLDKPVTTDFVSFYAAGSLADAGTPQLAYDHDAHYAAEQRATAPGIDYNFFYYPPVYLLICAPLARLPYLVAFVVFEAATLVLYLLVARAILAESGGAVLIPLLALPPVFWTIGLGQNAFLTAALFGAGTLLIDRRPIGAGLLFGALCYKPHFALLVPVALAAGGHWRAFGAFVASAAALSLLSLIVFGWPTWQLFLIAAAAAHAVYESGIVAFGGMVTPFGAAKLMGGTAAVAYATQAIATAIAASFVAFVWHQRPPLPMRAAALASATLVAVPLAIVYDLMLAGIAGLWLLRAEGAWRLPDWGRLALAVLVVLTVDPRGMAEHWHLPVGPFVTCGLFSLTAAVALQGLRRGQTVSVIGGPSNPKSRNAV